MMVEMVAALGEDVAKAVQEVAQSGIQVEQVRVGGVMMAVMAELEELVAELAAVRRPRIARSSCCERMVVAHHSHCSAPQRID